MATPSENNISNSPSSLSQFLQENSYTEEFREFLNSLPKETGWLTPDLYNYKGFWLEPFFLQGALTIHQHFQPQDSDIILSTFPKSGTVWLKALAFALITRKQFLAEQETHPLHTNNPHDLIPFLELSYAAKERPDFALTNGSRLLATHLPVSLLPKSVWESKGKVVYLCRNPKDTVVSFWHFMNKLRSELRGLEAMPFPEAFDSYCRGVCNTGPFWDHVSEYWKESLENPGKVLFLKYEEMKKEPEVHLRRMAAFLGCPFSEEEEECGVVSGILRLCSFESLSNLEVNKTSVNGDLGVENGVLFRKGKVGDWSNHMTEEMARRLDQIVQEKFTGTGLML
ncbi:PREDICTED: cytosolic sulfotransferase 12-like [Ipomoea nil]|uniref:cytosolic sulfotransferase 12-like n=1 Tax=Ipomoea nil TaxID=35883 RepID=UPI000900E760|nr:PREDICTED: cytosolic sulfotransferase 12-like [Ipomoea nil]